MESIACPSCGEPYARYLFEFGISFRCACGARIDPPRRPQTKRRAGSAPKEGPKRPDVRPQPGQRATPKSPSRPNPAIGAGVPSRRDPAPRPEIQEEERKIRDLRRRADRICFLIVATDYPAYEIEMEKRALRQWCQKSFPDKMEAYERIFEARFRRLWQQFRQKG